MVSTSAGMRCPECAYINRAIPIAAVEPGSKGMSAFAGLLTGLAGAYVLALLTFFQPFLTILAAPLYGRLVADAIKSFSEDDKGRTVEAVGVGSILLGSFIAFGLPLGNVHTNHVSMSNLSQAIVGLSVGLSIAVCYHHLKQRCA